MRSYIIYKLISPSGKQYIGQTYNIQKRFYHYKRINKITFQRLLSEEILKYGFDNFKKEILFSNLTKEESDKKEIELIFELKKYPDICLNISKGGDCGFPDTIITYKVDINGNILKKYSSTVEAALDNNCSEFNIASANKRKSFYTNNMFFIYKKYYDAGLFKNRLIKGEYLTKPIILLNDKGDFIKEFKSAKEAIKEINTTVGNISQCATGKRRRDNDYIWVFKKDYNVNKDYSLKNLKVI